MRAHDRRSFAGTKGGPGSQRYEANEGTMAAFRTIDDFTADRFTPTRWEGAEAKARFARQFIGFVEVDFSRERFTPPFYRRLSLTFGHIAHYDREGFYDTFFRTTEDKIRFLQQTLEHPCGGDPDFTYSDVERALQSWVRDNRVLARYEERWAARCKPRMTQAEWDAYPEEFKGLLGGRPHRLAQDEKTGATIFVPVEITGTAGRASPGQQVEAGPEIDSGPEMGP